MQDHRKLRVWKHAHELAIQLHRVTRNFSRRGQGSLSMHVARTAESIVLNIVEGCGTSSQREFARFLDIGIKSSAELEAQLELAKDYGVLGLERWKLLTAHVIDVRRMLCSLRAKVLESAATNRPVRRRPPNRKAQSVEPETRNAKRETPNVDPS
jgi:four helix bundle protein